MNKVFRGAVLGFGAGAVLRAVLGFGHFGYGFSTNAVSLTVNGLRAVMGFGSEGRC